MVLLGCIDISVSFRYAKIKGTEVSNICKDGQKKVDKLLSVPDLTNIKRLTNWPSVTIIAYCQ